MLTVAGLELSQRQANTGADGHDVGFAPLRVQAKPVQKLCQAHKLIGATAHVMHGFAYHRVEGRLLLHSSSLACWRLAANRHHACE